MAIKVNLPSLAGILLSIMISVCQVGLLGEATLSLDLTFD